MSDGKGWQPKGSTNKDKGFRIMHYDGTEKKPNLIIKAMDKDSLLPTSKRKSKSEDAALLF